LIDQTQTHQGATIVDSEAITIVSGLPRSGTSMMMKMLEAGGMQVLTDNVRTADEDNPKGYYEFERVKQIEEDKAWLEDAKGKVVKMIAALLKHLPPDYEYKVIFMRRNMEEILASQKQMLIRRGEPTDRISDEKMAALFQRHVQQVEAWLAEQPNIDVLYTHYNEILASPQEKTAGINQFLDSTLDVKRMAETVDPNLHRQRH
jgi:hypothetical protein